MKYIFAISIILCPAWCIAAEPTYAELKAENARLRAEIVELKKPPYWMQELLAQQAKVDAADKVYARKRIAECTREIRRLEGDPRGMRTQDKEQVTYLKRIVAENEDLLEGVYWLCN